MAAAVSCHRHGHKEKHHAQLRRVARPRRLGCLHPLARRRANPRLGPAADAAAIRAHIESIFQAFVDKDRAKLEATHGAKWRGFTPWSGHVIRGLDGYMKEATFPPNLPKGQGMVGYRIGEFDIVFYGDTAVVTFQAEVDRLQGTEKSTQKLTFIDVYHKDPAGWIQVASNTSLHPDAVFEMASQRRQLDEGERATN